MDEGEGVGMREQTMSYLESNWNTGTLLEDNWKTNRVISRGKN